MLTAQSPSPGSPSGEQHSNLQSPPFLCWSGFRPVLLVICEARIHGAPKPLWWKPFWCYYQKLQSITRQNPRHNAQGGNIQQHSGVYQVYGMSQDIYIGLTIARTRALKLPYFSVLSWRVGRWTYISDVSKNRKPELGQKGLMEQLGIGTVTPGDVWWRAEWESPVATATAIDNETPNQGWSFLWVLVNLGAQNNSWKFN